MLKQGVKSWNTWRIKHRDIVPDLSGAYLACANVKGTNLEWVNLRGTYLKDADLTGADLGMIFLRGQDSPG